MIHICDFPPLLKLRRQPAGQRQADFGLRIEDCFLQQMLKCLKPLSIKDKFKLPVHACPANGFLYMDIQPDIFHNHYLTSAIAGNI